MMKRMLNILLPMKGNDSEPDHNISEVLFWMSNPQSHVWICTKSLWLNRPPFSTSFPKRQRKSVLFYLPWLNVAIYSVPILNIYLSVRKKFLGKRSIFVNRFRLVTTDQSSGEWGLKYNEARTCSNLSHGLSVLNSYLSLPLSNFWRASSLFWFSSLQICIFSYSLL